MHAVIVDVTVNDPEAAGEALSNQVIPQVSQAPGFVAGYWVARSAGKGTSMVVFETEDQAQVAAAGVREMAGMHVTVESVDVGQVIGHA